MFKRFAFVVSALCLTIAPLAAHALPADAGSTDPAPVDVQAPPPDAADTAVSPPADTTSTGSFSANPCWDTKCAAETAACKADPVCVTAAAAGDLKNTTYSALANCGWKNCNDPSKGSCVGKCGKWDNTWPCNCDDACKDMGDCCADRATACPAAPAPAGSCAKSDCAKDSQGVDSTGAAANCYCDSTCATTKDCCPDYDTTCGKGGTGPCVPQCTGKKCGPDGCGKTCGVCGTGAVCDNSGQCLGGTTPTADAGGTTPGADTAGTTGGLDVKATGDSYGQILYTGTAPKSGCTAGTSAAPRAGILVVLGGLFAAVYFRRRRA